MVVHADQTFTKGHVHIVVRSAITGQILRQERVSNLVVESGRNLVAALLIGDAKDFIKQFAVGTNNAPPENNQTSLVAEVFRASITQASFSAGILTITLFLGATQANGFNLTECGEFNLSNTMFARFVHQAINTTAAITITYMHTVNLLASSA